MHHLEMLTKLVTQNLIPHVDKIIIQKKFKEENPAVF